MRYLFCLLPLLLPFSAHCTEQQYNRLFCQEIGGKSEVKHDYPGGSIRVDCETQSHVYEGGLDKRSSLDSVQQVVFASLLTKKTPIVLLHDTDGKLGIYEYRIQQVSLALGIKFLRNPLKNKLSRHR